MLRRRGPRGHGTSAGLFGLQRMFQLRGKPLHVRMRCLRLRLRRVPVRRSAELRQPLQRQYVVQCLLWNHGQLLLPLQRLSNGAVSLQQRRSNLQRTMQEQPDLRDQLRRPLGLQSRRRKQRASHLRMRRTRPGLQRELHRHRRLLGDLLGLRQLHPVVPGRGVVPLALRGRCRVRASMQRRETTMRRRRHHLQPRVSRAGHGRKRWRLSVSLSSRRGPSPSGSSARTHQMQRWRALRCRRAFRANAPCSVARTCRRSDGARRETVTPR